MRQIHVLVKTNTLNWKPSFLQLAKNLKLIFHGGRILSSQEEKIRKKPFSGQGPSQKLLIQKPSDDNYMFGKWTPNLLWLRTIIILIWKSSSCILQRTQFRNGRPWAERDCRDDRFLSGRGTPVLNSLWGSLTKRGEGRGVEGGSSDLPLYERVLLPQAFWDFERVHSVMQAQNWLDRSKI